MKNLENEDHLTSVTNHKITVEEKEYNDNWGSCCGKIDKRCLVYGIQMSMLFLIMIFCIFKLIHSADCNEQSTYLGLLTMIIGLIIPNPSMSE